MLTRSSAWKDIYSFQGVLSFALAVTAWRLLTLRTQPFNLSFDEAQYWIWAQTPSWGYFSKPPMIAWIINITTYLCGDKEACLRSGAPLAYLLGSLALYSFGQRLYGPVISFWAAILFLTLPGVSFSALVMSVDPLLLMFWALALAVLVRALLEEHLAWWGALGGVIGLGFLSKYAMLFFVLSLLLYLLLSPTRRSLLRASGPWLSVTLAFSCMVPNLLWNFTHDFATIKHTGENIHLIGSFSFHTDKGLAFICAQFAIFGPILMAMLARLITSLMSVVKTDQNACLEISFLLPILVTMIVEAFLSRAHANWAAPGFLSATVLVVAWLASLNRIVLLKGVLLLHLSVTAVLYNIDSMIALLPSALAAQYDPFKRIRGWDAIGQMLMDIRVHHPDTALLFDTRKVLAPVVYYARPIAFDAVIWNPSITATNHFALLTDLNQAVCRSFLLVTEHHTASHVAPFFRQTSLISVLRVQLYANLAREIRVFRCEAFQGYG